MKQILASEARRFANTVIWSWAGWRAAWVSEKTLRQWTLVNIASAGLAFYLDLTAGERALILCVGLMILVAELLNTAIEEVVDYISFAQDARAKRAKDCGSAAVAVAAIAGGLVWAVILLG